MKKISFITVLITATLFIAVAQNRKSSGKAPVEDLPRHPKLVVGIVVDQMRYDYINRYWNKFGNDGFKRLLNQGTNFDQTNYNYMPTYTGPGHASIFTGTTPAVHGIIGNNWYEREEGKTVYCAEDKTVKPVGSGTEEGLRSPRRMLAGTIGDQLHLSNNAQSKVVGVALKDRSAIMPAGHTANAAFWYDGTSGNFISSSYYMKELPAYLQEFNKQAHPARLLQEDWNTLMPIDQYTESLADNNPYEGRFKGEDAPVFPHKLPALMEKNGKFGIIRSTPQGNVLTRLVAEAIIKGENLGKNSASDFLSVSFSSPDYIGHMYGPQSIEVEDCYLRLDLEIAAFLRFLDSWCGKNNTLVFLTADHGAVENPQFLNDVGIPSGFFNDKVMMDSLKLALKKKFADSLVLAYENEQIFLDRQRMERKGIDKRAVEDFCAAYLMKFKGVAHVMTAHQMAMSEFIATPRREVQKGYNFRRSGDVCVLLQPGWVGDWDRVTGTTHGAPWSYDTHVPLIFWGWKVRPVVSDIPVEITDISPTVCTMLGVQFPHGCTGKTIPATLFWR